MTSSGDLLLIQGWSLCLLCLLHWQADSLLLVPPGKFLQASRSTYFKCFSEFWQIITTVKIQNVSTWFYLWIFTIKFAVTSIPLHIHPKMRQRLICLLTLQFCFSRTPYTGIDIVLTLFTDFYHSAYFFFFKIHLCDYCQVISYCTNITKICFSIYCWTFGYFQFLNIMSQTYEYTCVSFCVPICLFLFDKCLGLGLMSLIFPTKGLNPVLLHCRQIPSQLSHKGSPGILKWVAYPFSSGSFQPRDRTGVSCIAGGFLPTELSGKSQDWWVTVFKSLIICKNISPSGFITYTSIRNV